MTATDHDNSTNKTTAIDAAIRELYVPEDETTHAADVDIAAIVNPSGAIDDAYLSIKRSDGLIIADDYFNELDLTDVNLPVTETAHDFVITAWLDWDHDGSLDTADEESREIHVHVYRAVVDLDIDSDNDSGFFGVPDHSDQEEYLEENPYGLGKLILPNWGDFDSDGVLNCWDGYFVGSSYLGQDTSNASELFVPITVTLPEGIDFSTAKLELDYNVALTIPSGSTSLPPTYGSGTIRIWTKNGPERRNGAVVTNDPSDSGDFVYTNLAVEASPFGFSDTNRTVTFYIEGIAEADHTGTYEEVQQYGKPTSPITVKLFPTGDVNGPVVTDKVNYIVASPNSFYYQLLTREDLHAALASQGIYNRDDLQKYCMKLLTFEELLTNGFIAADANMLVSDDPVTGFAAGVYHDYITGANLLVFQGTDATSWNDWYNNIKQGLNPPAPQYTKAMQIRDALSSLPGGPASSLYTPATPKRWLIAGHSLGGGLAAAASMVSTLPAITFNAAGVNLNTLNAFYRPDLTSVAQMQNEALGRITSYVVNYDILNNLQDGLQWLDSIDMPVPPASLGVRVTLPSNLGLPMVWGTFKIIAGSVGLVAGGAGTTTVISGVYTVLSTMVEAHSLYVEGLLLSYGFPLS